MVAAALAAVLVLWPSRHGDPPAPVPEVASRLVVRETDLGVACPTPNSIACGRVGIAVWPRGHVASISGTLGGQTTALRRDGTAYYYGYVHVPGLLRHVKLEASGRWTGVHPFSTTLRVVVTRPDGERRATTVHVQLSPGWG